MRRNRGRRTTRRPKTAVFMHVALMGDGMSIFESQVNRLRIAGLWGRSTICVGVVGEEADDFIAPEGSVVVHRSNNVHEFEYPTLEQARIFSIANQSHFVLYVHTKGASLPGAPGKMAWREEMEHMLIDKYKRCVGMMLTRSAEAAGLMYIRSKRGSHFAGNFWWARASYLAHRPPLATLSTRMFAEKWLLFGSSPKLIKIRGRFRCSQPYQMMDLAAGYPIPLRRKTARIYLQRKDVVSG